MNFLPTLPVFAAYLAAVLLIITFTPRPGHDALPRQGGQAGDGRGMAAMLGASIGVLIHTTVVAFGAADSQPPMMT